VRRACGSALRCPSVILTTALAPSPRCRRGPARDGERIAGRGFPAHLKSASGSICATLSRDIINDGRDICGDAGMLRRALKIRRLPQCSSAGSSFAERLAADPSPEGDEFEPSVPRKKILSVKTVLSRFFRHFPTERDRGIGSVSFATRTFSAGNSAALALAQPRRGAVYPEHLRGARSGCSAIRHAPAYLHMASASKSGRRLPSVGASAAEQA